MKIFDSSGIEAWVTENNPKFANRIIKQLKAYAKTNHFNSDYDPYKAAYGSIPTHSASNDQLRQLYVDGHFCNPILNLFQTKKSDSPDEDKSIHDAWLLPPTLQDFFKTHPLIVPKTFLGDAAFDSVSIYELLLSGDTFSKNNHFSKAFIPLNERSKLKYPDYTINSNGIPCCLDSTELPMKPEGIAKTKAGLTRYKFICPKTEWVYNPETHKSHRECKCKNPCTTSACGRMVYLQQQSDYIAFQGTIRGTKEWERHIQNKNDCRTLHKSF